MVSNATVPRRRHFKFPHVTKTPDALSLQAGDCGQGDGHVDGAIPGMRFRSGGGGLARRLGRFSFGQRNSSIVVQKVVRVALASLRPSRNYFILLVPETDRPYIESWDRDHSGCPRRGLLTLPALPQLASHHAYARA
jgi:hypothetical protein